MKKKTGPHLKPSFIEKLAESMKLIPDLHQDNGGSLESIATSGKLEKYPAPDRWDHWVEYEAKSWPRKDRKEYALVPTICFNCESGCGLVAYIDKKTDRIRKFEGNPFHPGSRGRNCAKGPATINQINDTDRILHPMKRVGERGSGEWKKVTWDEARKTFLQKSGTR